jgi:hypothetical protein
MTLEVLVAFFFDIELNCVVTSRDCLNIKIEVAILLNGPYVVEVNDGEAINEHANARYRETDDLPVHRLIGGSEASDLEEESTIILAVLCGNFVFGFRVVDSNIVISV